MTGSHRSMSPDDRTAATIAEWRDSLINLTGTNRLLNFRYGPGQNKTSTIVITDPSADLLLSDLGLGRTFRFVAEVPAEQDDGAGPDEDDEAVAPSGEADEDVALPDEADEYPATRPAFVRSTPLVVNADSKELVGALRNLASKSTREFLDRGLWILYLAFGMLSWTDEDDHPYTSPLLLVPVRLTSQGRGFMPTLTMTEDDAVINPALALRMIQLGIELPTISEIEDPSADAIFGETRRAIAEKSAWQVHEDVVLSFFSFQKEAMYRDLLDNAAEISAHPIVAALSSGGSGRQTSHFLFDAIPDDQIDAVAPPETNPLILDADSSQRACVAAAVAGHSFVMDGPPGTGKSQTIANTIASLLDAGKTVLFVSEKAAALDVVRNRLTEIGLGSYVLELHSQNATRREVASALGAALDNIPVAAATMSPIELSRVTARRTELNAYADAMNRPREPLGYSLHEVIGWIANLNDVPVAPATGTPPQDLTVDKYEEIVGHAAALTRAWRPAAQASSFEWRALIDRSPLNGRLFHARAALEELAGLAAVNQVLADAFGLVRPSDAHILSRLLRQASTRPPHCPDKWLTLDSLDETETSVSLLIADLQTVAQAEDAAASQAGVSARQLPDPAAVEPIPSLDLIPSAVEIGSMIAPELARAREQLGAEFGRLGVILRQLDELTAVLGLPAAITLADAEDTVAVAAIAAASDRPLARWLEPGGLGTAQTAADELAAAHHASDAAAMAARSAFTDAVLEIDVSALAARFATQHHGLRKLSSTYRADVKLMATVTRPGVAAATARSALSHVIEWQRARAALAYTQQLRGPALGRYYDGPNTVGAKLHQALEAARIALGRGRSEDLSVAARSIADEAGRNQQVIDLADGIKFALGAWAGALAGPVLGDARPQLVSRPLRDVADWLRAHAPRFLVAERLTDLVSAATNRALTLAEAEQILALAADANAARARLAARDLQYSELLDGLYDGTRTDAANMTSALRWAKECRLLRGHDQPLTSDEAKALLDAIPSPRLASAATTWTAASTEIMGAFDLTRRPDLAGELDDYTDAAELLRALSDDDEGPSEWFAHVDARAALGAHGLDVAVEFCVSRRIVAADVPNVLRRALLTEWIDDQLASDPATAMSRSVDRDSLIKEYRALDKTLVASAASTIINSVNSRRPKTDIGEAAIIRHESAKKRRHMPVRTLIERTRHITTQIKPCFMMSPLAVSQYLPADLKFDVVIFDEASQVSPADSINCIYRGRSLIAAGDQKQLPPTRFFASSADDSDGEWDEDETIASQDFESVLDLAKASGALNSLTLRWHYRSRHEALIAFSNAKFYQGQMITFPGAEQVGDGVGVELFPVAGVYRRGSSRDNPVEAEKVAQRVIHHFDTRPAMTLGVVTFSEAQAATIEFAIEAARRTRPDLDRFFESDRADRLGGFFVKNLESVQGDERDVMIFSIGYGPDEAGKITMNFGPINRAGGWRRLNVAITRARYRNEIVSSVNVGDFTPSQSEGVRHLRSYLDYAIRGTAALALDTASGGDAESPFEESVIAVIRSWGFEVTPQVGTAGYRIDMAVRHPDHPGVYVIGVECDGFQYHSSKAARDRDRLREQVLRGLGWHLHRIWGTAWYRNRHAEEARLREAIDIAVASPLTGLITRYAETDVDLIERPLISMEPVVLTDRPDWAAPYQVAQLPPLPRWIDLSDASNRYHIVDFIRDVVQIEGPIHRSVLQQRLRDAWDIGRIGARIRETIDGATLLASVIQDGDFLSMPDQSVAVRVPSHDCDRTSDQVADSEIQVALEKYVLDAGSVSAEELSAAVARLFRWKRTVLVQSRLNALIADLVSANAILDRDGTLRPQPNDEQSTK